jgi:ParB/RepB/Spo0J family partition protein
MAKQGAAKKAAAVDLAPTPGVFMRVPLDQIQVESNVRKEFEPEALQELAASIKAQGVLQPILLCIPPDKKLGDKVKRYVLVAGERRVRASRMAGLKEIPAIVRAMTPEEVELAQATENLQRRDLLPIEEADAYKIISKHANVRDTAELAARVGKRVEYVAQRLRLLDLSALGQKLLHDGVLPFGHALEVAKVGPETQDAVIKEIVFEYWDDKKDEPGDYGHAQPLEVVKQQIETQIYLKLDGAPWPKDWAPEGYPNGACATCRFNTANDGVLFAKEKGSGRCTNSVSYELKMRRWIEERAAAIKAETSHEALFIASQYFSSYQIERFNIPKGTLNSDAYRLLGKKEGACEHSRTAVVVYGTDRGHTKTICADKGCKVHGNRPAASLSSTTKSPREQQKETETRNERKQELFNMRVAEPVRLEVFRRLKEKREGGASFELRPVDRFYMNQIAMRLIQQTPYKTKQVVKAVMGGEWNAPNSPIDDSNHSPQRCVKKLEAIDDRELFWLMFLTSIAHFGENEYMHHEVSQSAVVALAEQHEIPYAEIDAEERLKQSPKKYVPAHEAHLEAVRAGKAGVKDAPKVYGDPPAVAAVAATETASKAKGTAKKGASKKSASKKVASKKSGAKSKG